ncbi:swr1 complex component [Arachnomyces sp. PD_36]|nr:swr1 complex component [Arachnomyces sp. PD_36]
MQNGSLNGTSQHHNGVTPEPNGKLRDPPALETPSDSRAGDSLLPELEGDNAANNQNEGPPPKKRKLTDPTLSHRSTSRPVSPPWKKVTADGPTSFIEGGRRKSSRTNVVPLELQPQSEKRHTRAARKQYESKAKPSRASWHTPASNASTPAAASSEMNGRRSIGSKATNEDANMASPGKEFLRKNSNSRNGYDERSIMQSPNSRLSASTSKTRLRATSASHTRARPGHPPDPPSPRTPRRKIDITDASPSVGLRSPNMERRNTQADMGSAQKRPRLRFKVKMPAVGAQNPAHILPARKHASFREWVEHEYGQPEEGNYSGPGEALEEARVRQRILDEGEPGNILSQSRCSAYIQEQQEEPPQQYSHQDHLVAHALYFKRLLDREHKVHRNHAKALALACADAWRKRHKHPDDVIKEQEEEMRHKRRQLFKDLQRQFDLVRAEVEKGRLAQWEEQKKAMDQEALNRAIKQSTLLFEKRRMEASRDAESDTDLGSSADDTDHSERSEEGEYESNMSGSDSESESNGEHDDDEGLTAEELRAKYANLPLNDLEADSENDSYPRTESPSQTSAPQSDGRLKSRANSTVGDVPLEDVNPALLDDSDESTDMDDDMGDSDGEGETEEEDDDDDDDDDSATNDGEEPGLLGFFAGENLTPAQQLDTDGSHNPEQNLETDDQDEVSLIPNGASGQGDNAKEMDISVAPAGSPIIPQKKNLPNIDASSQASPGTYETKPSPEAESVSSYGPNNENRGETPGSHKLTHGLKTPIPHLLRGTLREYQHFGLDWLAGLYNNNINGILADEMGLGKTIQTIALLAHLAVEHEVWGPHLVVVPTSVMLNWEMEFKKWCPGFKILTYYGTQDERRVKRRGWMDDDRWHVCITSYQLVLQDQQTFRRRNWHYMVLDEAHNIKNFRSQRWQTLLGFKSRARLLLTGTPLQNNLTELWSLLFFLMPSDEGEAGVEGFADLKNFSEWFRRPVEQILEHGRETMDDEAKGVVTKLHTVLRPYLLRRLKADVEKQMPAKYEHVVYCRLSKRQRYLYDGFMSRAQTKETLTSGNYLSIINCLMQLRKVCNHPDLFETRPITTSFAMPRSAIAGFEIKELMVRRRLLREDPLSTVDLDFLNLVPISREETSRRLADDGTRIMAYGPLRMLRGRQYNRTNWMMDFDGSSIRSTLTSMENAARKSRMGELERCLYFDSKRHGRRPVYGKSLLDFLTIDVYNQSIVPRAPERKSLSEWLSNQSPVLGSMITSIEDRARSLESGIQKFACITPAVVAFDITDAALTPIKTYSLTKAERNPPYDPFHEAQMRLSIAFPDKRLLQFDCGKLQRLDKLLRDLQAGGHRALIFTQMTKMLDVLEQFLNIHGHRYLRLDGATKVEQRQILTERFNNDNRILAFILSSRSGGLGINLTGADTVIFYDLDWNPAMDKQCQDRCHRIGQTRDVHIYRLVSEYTIESNILRKANQKRMLDDVVIQEGEFTTEYMNKPNTHGLLGEEEPLEGRDEASMAMDRVLDTRAGKSAKVFEQAEDKEDFDAAKTAEKEVAHADEGDFEENGSSEKAGPSQAATPATTVPAEDDGNGEVERLAENPPFVEAGEGTEIEPQPNHIDDYLLRFMEWNLKDEPLVLPPDKRKKRSRRGKEHLVRRQR